MGKTVAYVAAAVVFLGIGALTAGLAVWFTYPQQGQDMPSEARTAQCVLMNTTGVTGTLNLTQADPTELVFISGVISGLSPGLHGFHVHQWGVNDKCTDAGGHYNPGNFQHAAPNATERHVGDLGNIEANDSMAIVEIKDEVITLWGERSIVGRAIVVHKGEDDLGLGGDEGSLATGNAGPRVSCCNIYLAP